MATQIIIDGTDYTGQVGGLESLVISFQKDDSTKTVNTVVSSTLVFYDDAYNYLLNRFFDEPESKNKESKVQLITDCCDDDYFLLLRGDALTVCFADCRIEGQLVERSSDLEAFNSIRNTVTSESVITGQVSVPQLEVCIDVGFVNIALFTILRIFEIIVIILNTITFGLLNDLVSSIANYESEILGCNIFKNAYNVRDVLTVCASGSGLTFESSIFDNTPYNNLHYVDTNQTFNFLTCQQFVDVIAIPFNADYQIRNGVLYFERKDFFLESVVQLVNVEEAYSQGLADSAPCYIYTPENENALGRFEYSSDGQDNRANDILDLTNDIVEWNAQQYPNRSGEFTRTIPFSPARFTRDRNSNATLDNNRPSGVLIMSDPISQFPKLVIGNAVGQGLNTFLKPQKRARNNQSGRFDYTYQMWFDAALDEPELYQQFHFIDDPNVTPLQPYELVDFTFAASCDQIQLVRDNGVDVFVSTRLGKGRPQQVDINYDLKTITVRGVKIEVN